MGKIFVYASQEDFGLPSSHLHADQNERERHRKESMRARQVTDAIRLWRMHVPRENCILSAGRCLATNTPVNIHNNRKAIASRHSSRWNISLVCPPASQTDWWTGRQVDRQAARRFGTSCYPFIPTPGILGLLWLNVANHLARSSGTVCPKEEFQILRTNLQNKYLNLQAAVGRATVFFFPGSTRACLPALVIPA